MSTMCKTRAKHLNLPPALMLLLPATNTPALTPGTNSSDSSAGTLLAGTQDTSSFLVHALTLHELLPRFCICPWSQQPPEVLAGFHGWFWLEYTTFHCLALEGQLHKKKKKSECSLFYSTEECSLPISSKDDLFSPAQEIGNIQWNHLQLIPVLHTSHLSCGFPLEIFPLQILFSTSWVSYCRD